MTYKITMRPGHPKKQFRRDGHLFQEGVPVVLEFLSEAMEEELDNPGTYLKCEEVSAAEATAAALEAEAAAQQQTEHDERPSTSQLLKMKRDELIALAQQEGIDVSGKPTKAHLVGWLEKRYAAQPIIDGDGDSVAEGDGEPEDE